MSRLLLERIYYPVLTLGYGKRLGMWVRGCARKCPGCISPHLQDQTGKTREVSDIIRMLPPDFRADGLTVSGGEPFDQAEGVWEFVSWFGRKISRDILIYTGYTLEELRDRKDLYTDRILDNIAVLVDGPYMEAFNDGRGIRGSSNQRIIVRRFPERYRDADQWIRQVQYVAEDESLLQIGVPPADHIDEKYGTDQ